MVGKFREKRKKREKEKNGIVLKEKKQKRLDGRIVVDEADITEGAVRTEDELVVTFWSLYVNFRLSE